MTHSDLEAVLGDRKLEVSLISQHIYLQPSYVFLFNMV